MRKSYALILLILSPILFTDCSSGKKAYEQGDYYEAVIKAVNRLRKNTSHKKSRETLRKSYPMALQTLESSATNAISSNAEFKYRNALYAYQKINNMGEEIKRSPGALRVIQRPKLFYDKVANLKEMAAKESYDAGMIALERDTREDAKQAYFLFSDANEFVPGYKDSRDRMEEARFIATLKIVVEQIPVPSRRYNLSANFFQDKVEEFLHNEFRANQFVRFYTPTEVESNNLPYIDQRLIIQFEDFTVGETHTERNTETVSRDSVKVGTVTLDDGSKVDAYNTVYAKLTTYQKVVISKGVLSMQVFDVNSKAVLTHRRLAGQFEWVTRWGSFNGDERALTDEELAICEQREIPPPGPQNLFIEFTRPIYDQLVGAVNEFYSRY